MIVTREFSGLKNGPERRRGVGPSPRLTVARETTDDVEPTELRYVGPATAAVIDEADFEAGDILARTVSYADLLAAGVNPGVAANLRREYSLVWSLQWVAGANLSRRAVTVSGLEPEQREWIASSAGATARICCSSEPSSRTAAVASHPRCSAGHAAE